MRRKLDQIIIPKVDVHEATIHEVIQLLAKKGTEYDPSPPGERGVTIIFEPDSAPPHGHGVLPGLSDPSAGETRVTFSQNPISLGAALRTITGLAGLQLRIEPYCVRIVSKNEPEPMATRDIHLRADYFVPREEAMDKTAAEDARKARNDLRTYLAQNGVDLPTGSAAILSDDGTRLTIHTAARLMQPIQQLLSGEPLWQQIPEPINQYGNHVPGPKESKELKEPPGGTPLEVRKMNTTLHRTVLPAVDLEKVSLDAAIDELNALATRFESPKVRALAELNIAIRDWRGNPAESLMTNTPGSPDNPWITYHADHVSLWDALQAVARQAHFTISVGPNGASLSRDLEFARAETQRRLEAIQIPELALDHVSLADAVKTLGNFSVPQDQNSPDASPILLFVNDNRRIADPWGSKRDPLADSEPGSLDNPWIQYRAQNVSLWTAVNAVARAAEFHVELEPVSVCVCKGPESEALVTHEYHPPPGFFYTDGPHYPIPPALQHKLRPPGEDPFVYHGPKFPIYVLRTNSLIVRDTEAIQQLYRKLFDDAWRDYYASDDWKNRNSPRKPSAHGPATDPSSPHHLSPAEIEQRLKCMIIPRLEFRSATFREAIEFLKKKSAELEDGLHGPPQAFVPLKVKANLMADPPFDYAVPPAGIRGVFHIELQPGDTNALTLYGPPLPVKLPWDARLTLSAKDVSVMNALRAVMTAAHAKFWFDYDGLQIASLEDPDPLFTRDIAIPPGFFRSLERNDRRKGTAAAAAARKNIRGSLSEQGVILPEGSELILNDSGTRLTVHTTKAASDQIEKLLTDPPASASRPPATTQKSSSSEASATATPANPK
jgi:hypothetical protein